ncbi:MAG TPA: carboxypeptidase regulatory-like domain-containing protein [Terriglobales bacterium]|jgi:plastocyanin|nr:carboxypeptidase regulatory-like domain-containing protein [Terriglobales bacterium]
MKAVYKYKLAALSSAFLLLALVVMLMGRKVDAAPPSGTSITGTVKLNGTPPPEKVIDMSAEPSCAKEHARNSLKAERVVVGPNGGLQNVVIYVSQGLSGNEAPSTEVQTWNQKGCQYIPHVLALNPGQHFKVENSDQTSHNVHPQPRNNSEWNKSQPPGSPPFDLTWANPEVPIVVKCNIHPWMRGYMAVVKGPYAVTDNSGAFRLDGLAPGSYTLTAWQEEYGTQTQRVTVAAGKPTAVSFTYKAK